MHILYINYVFYMHIYAQISIYTINIKYIELIRYTININKFSINVNIHIQLCNPLLLHLALYCT